MTVQINKVFNSIDDGINNMLDAIWDDYSKSGLHTEVLMIFVISSLLKLERNILRLVESLTTMIRWVKFGTFVVNTDDDKLFQRGDVLKDAGFNAPARNAPRGNVLDGGFNIDWTEFVIFIGERLWLIKKKLICWFTDTFMSG